jgi:hypothetical protein
LLHSVPKGVGEGSDVPVRYFGHVVVYSASGSREWFLIAVVLVAAAVALVMEILTFCARGLGLWLPWMHKPLSLEDVAAMADAEYARRRYRNQHPGPVRRRHHRRT